MSIIFQGKTKLTKALGNAYVHMFQNDLFAVTTVEDYNECLTRSTPWYIYFNLLVFNPCNVNN